MDGIHPNRIMAKKANKRRYRTPKRKLQSNVPFIAYVDFQPYTGRRWKLPSGLTVNDAIRSKFSSLETYVPCVVIYKLKAFINGTYNAYNSLPLTTRKHSVNSALDYLWQPPARVTEYLHAAIERDIYEWKVVKSIYLKLFKMRRFLNGLIHRWRINKCIKNVKNTEDVVTMEVPKNCIQLLDFPNKLSYVYEARTLKKLIESRITLSDYMFPNPLAPINPFTNAAFTRGQLMSIILQCKKKGEFSWILDRFYASECDLRIFTLRFRQPLKILAIEAHFKGPIYKYKDEVLDFFQVEADAENLPDDKFDTFSRRMTHRPGCEFVKEWIALTRDLYIARELQDIALLAKIRIQSSDAIGRAYYILN
jgi:hypothetical protein